jgi:hypothetical protein
MMLRAAYHMGRTRYAGARANFSLRDVQYVLSKCWFEIAIASHGDQEPVAHYLSARRFIIALRSVRKFVR